ncbi:unnamed protein product [Cladocopium goreaui]|uniref:Alpha-1,3-glucan synthase n=1 Tax=Cladocopium goreaui TaxID=2562237 RepID=A0A9P1GGI7_9DINO|nr:unnamed protein product [Cladocopium goreaui]
MAEAELLVPLAELLMPHLPIAELFRSFPSPKGWGGNYLEPDLAAYGVLKDENAALFVEYGGYWRHGKREGLKMDQKKNKALLMYAPKGSYVIRISHTISRPLRDNVLWVKAATWRSGCPKQSSKIYQHILRQAINQLKGSLNHDIKERLRLCAEKAMVVPSTSSLDFINAAIAAGNRNTMDEIALFLETGGFDKKDIDLMLEKALVRRTSVEKRLAPALLWFLDLGLTKSQIAKAVSTCPQVLGYSIDQNLKPTVQWFLDLGLTESQIAKAASTCPQILGYSIEQNLKPTVQWFLDLGLTKSQIAKAVSTCPYILGYSIEQNLKPTVQWFLDLGLTKSQVAKAVSTCPQILGLSIDQNLKPTVQWFLDLGLTKSRIAKAAATFPQILGYSIEQNLKPTVQWLLDLGLTKSQVAKAVSTCPQILGFSIDQNLKPTVQCLLGLGLTKTQVVKAAATFPQILGLSIDHNLKPTVQWFLDFGLTKSQVAKAVSTCPQILGLSIEQNLKPTVQWFLDLGLTKSQVAKAVSTCPQILGYSIAKNLKAKMLVLNGFLGANRSAHLVAKWPQLLGYSYRRLTTRLQILAEQDKTDKLTTAMSLTEVGGVGILAWNYRTRIYLSIVKDLGLEGHPGEATFPNIMQISGPRVEPKHVICAAIEHTIPERGVKVSAGGLGKVLDQMLREHPQCTLSLVHPMFGDVDYGELEDFDEIRCVVDGKEQTIQVYTMQSELNGIKRVWYILSRIERSTRDFWDPVTNAPSAVAAMEPASKRPREGEADEDEHEVFTEKVKTAPYPPSMTKVRTLRYFSLWNQATAALIRKLKPDIYHCMDYHAALAPLYLEESEQIPIILVLHNADYMGVVETDFISDRFWKTVTQLRRLSLILNLKVATIRKYCMFEGRFNMLKAGVTYIKQTQAGYGICAVSENYAVELKRERTLFAGLPYLISLDNATDPADIQTSIEKLRALRFEAKGQLQRHCGLDEDPGAKILIFIGRWVKQKGVDHIAMLTPAFLRSHPEVQIILAGPPDDACGLYAGTLLDQLGDEFKGRLFVCTKFFRLPEELRRGAHLCFTPSCDVASTEAVYRGKRAFRNRGSEPFGYVDVEFGLLGVPSVGAAIGGLGKMPGVYFRQQNSDDSKSLIDSFFCSVDHALNLPDTEYWEMALNATKADFPFDTWRANLSGSYSKAITNFKSFAGEGNLLFDAQQHADAGTREVLNEAMAPRKATVLRRMSSTAQEAIFQGQMKGKVKDAEQLQSQICQADQRLTERSHMTQWLMKPFARGLCLRIHVAPRWMVGGGWGEGTRPGKLVGGDWNMTG